MAASENVRATWVGPFEAETADGLRLVPGESVVDVPAGEAHASDHWEVVTPRKDSAKADTSKDGSK